MNNKKPGSIEFKNSIIFLLYNKKDRCTDFSIHLSSYLTITYRSRVTNLPGAEYFSSILLVLLALKTISLLCN